jgi:hypothetical protein
VRRFQHGEHERIQEVLREMIELGLFGDARLDRAWTRRADAAGGTEHTGPGAPRRVVFDGDERGHAPAVDELGPDELARQPRREQHQIDVIRDVEKAVSDGEAVREDQRLPARESFLYVRTKHVRLHLVGHQAQQHRAAFHRVADREHFEAVALGLVAVMILAIANDD